MRRILVLAAALSLGVSGVALAATAHQSKADSGTAWVGVTHQEGGFNYVSGDIKDKLLGRGAIVYLTTVRVTDQPGSLLVDAKKITLYTPKGTLVGKGHATTTTAADGTTTVHDGKFNLTRGTAKLKGHSLKGTFSGTYADGVYTFTYKGTYR